MPELRLMTAVEALTGLVLITWTASFTFLVMQKNWGFENPSCPLRSPDAISTHRAPTFSRDD